MLESINREGKRLPYKPGKPGVKISSEERAVSRGRKWSAVSNVAGYQVESSIFGQRIYIWQIADNYKRKFNSIVISQITEVEK